MLLILSNPDDAHVPLVTPKLEERGAEYLWFDPGHFPGEAHIDFGLDSSGITRRTLFYQGQEYDLSAVTAVWYRRPSKPKASVAMRNGTHCEFVELVSERFLAGFWETLECRWLPSRPAADRLAHNKLIQLALAARLGFKLPTTLISNNPRNFLELFSKYGSRMVSKSLAPMTINQDGQDHQIGFTHLVHRRHAIGYRSVQHEPVIFQNYIAKRLEIRVTIVGSSVFAAEIGSQGSRTTRDDCRRLDDERVSYKPHILPDEIVARCRRLVEELDLAYGAIDLILTPEGEYVFLEINSNGQWGWIESLTDLPIADAVADFLTGK
ncbi:MAG: MvdC/MvdD family ATP grasp protein [Nitrospira sp.]